MLKSSRFIGTKESYPRAVAELLRKEVGLWSGSEIASVFYRHYVEGLRVGEMGFKTDGYRTQAQYIVNAKEKGAYYDNKQLFDYCLERYPEALDKLFKVETVTPDPKILTELCKQ